MPRTVLMAADSSVRTWLARPANTRPAGVTSTVRVVRLSSSTPSARSRSRTVWLIQGADTRQPLGRAAEVAVPRATARNASSWRSVTFCTGCLPPHWTATALCRQNDTMTPLIRPSTSAIPAFYRWQKPK